MRALPVLLLLSFVASAQTRPLGLPRFPNPPESNGADPVLYENGVLYNTTLACSQRSNGATWKCLTTAEEVAAANTAQDAAIASTYMTLTSANTVITTMQANIGTNATGISGLASRVTSLEGQATALQTAVTAAQSSATAAASSASAAQTAATAAQTASTANATAIAALTTRVSALETTVAALNARPRQACTTFNVASGFSVPLTGISTVISVPLAGVPVAAVCDVGAPTRMALGARPDPVVTTAGTVSMAFVSNGGLLSSIIGISSGTYSLCCTIP